MTSGAASAWGLMPDTLRQRLQQVEWDNTAHLRERLVGVRPFPIRIGLKPPSGRQALVEMARFQTFVTAWRSWPGPCRVEYEVRDLSQIGRHELPIALTIERFDDLAAFLGPHAVARQRHWESVFAPLTAIAATLRPRLIGNLGGIEALDIGSARELADVLRQLKPGLGRNRYLRALPLTGADTKFVEQHWGLLADLADALHDGAIERAGGMEVWLGCLSVPEDWLYVRPLCERCREHLSGLDILRVPTATLLAVPLPGRRVLAVENLAAGYALPPMPETVAVFGSGANLSWTRAPWLGRRQFGYWGDIDTWGLHHLTEVRRNQPHVQALLMDRATIAEHCARVVDVKAPNPVLPDGLIADEAVLYRELLDRRYGGTCLEQERISVDWISAALDQWKSTPNI